MNAKGRLAFLDADIEKAGEIVYPEFHAYFSKDGIRDLQPVHHGLFEPEDSPPNYCLTIEDAWSKDRWVF